MKLNKRVNTNEKSKTQNKMSPSLAMKDFLESQRIAHIGTWRLNIKTNEVVWSEELYKMYGFDSKLPVPPYTEHMKLFTVESWDKLAAALEKTRTLGIPYELELNTVKSDGTNGWMWVRGEAETDDEGNVTSIWGAAQDITERKTTEENLRLSENRFRIMLQSLDVGIVVHAADTSIIDCNDRAIELLGLSRDQMFGKAAIDPKWKFLREDESHMPLEEYPVNLIFSNKRPLKNEVLGIYRAQNQDVKWVLVNGTMVFDINGSILQAIISFIDITELKNSKDLIDLSEKKFKSYTDNALDGIFIINRDGYYIDANAAGCKMFACTKDELLGMHASQFLADYELQKGVESFEKLASVGKYKNEFEFVKKDGSRFIGLLSASKIDENKFIGFVNDISNRKAMEVELFAEKEKFRTTLISVGDGVISTDKFGNVMLINKAAELYTGWTQAEAEGRPLCEVFNIINEFSKQSIENPVEVVLTFGKTVELANHTILISKAGRERFIEDSAAPIIDEQGKIAGVVLVFRDFTEKKKILDEIEYLNFHDHLTGLYNRRFYETELIRLNVKRNWPLTIMIGDINGLKLINDSFGHAIGDQLLLKVTEAIRKSCRADDIIARLGGDEFVILLPKTQYDEAQQLIKRINDLLKTETIQGIEISISFGHATKTDEIDEIGNVFKKAEDAMYQNKIFEGPSTKGKVIDNIIFALNSKSRREEIHSRRVAILCEKMGQVLGLEEYRIKELRTFGLLHDIGKIVIQDTILNKPGKLSESEWIEMKSHAETGYRILSTNSDMKDIADYVLAHHERWDGNGYPRGLKGKEIPLPSRICSIADAYDAMVNDRSYKPHLTEDEALVELRKNSGTQFDPVILSEFIEKVLYK